jgi:alpha-ribazole phosphatase
MSRIWLVRHGPTHAKVMLGWTDLPADLSDRAALARLNAHLPRVPVISSDLSRAVATADALAPRPRLPHDPALRELHFGSWENRGWAEVEAEDPALARAFWDRPGTICAPGGECWDALVARVGTALERLAQEAGEVIVVAHFGVIVAAVQLAEGLTAEAALAHRIDTLSVTCVEFGRGARLAGPINHIP